MADFVFNVSRLLGQQPGAHRVEAVEAPCAAMKVPELIKPVLGMARLTRIESAILVSGNMRATVRVACARCDRDLDVDVEFDLADEFVPVGVDLSEANQDFADCWRLDKRHNIDLIEVLAEGVVSAIPPFPACDYGCGISALEEQTTRPRLDPRLEPLDKIRQEMFPDELQDDG
jgi:uncharacterized metal-binding protein YceD (DUF177 family)